MLVLVRKYYYILLVSTFLMFTGGVQAAPPSGGSWNQSWGDEFTTLNTNDWIVKDAGWNEWNWDYGVAWRHQADNVSCNGNSLVIKYKNNNGVYYSSGRADTALKATYGYFETRMHITPVVGKQSAFWMMPEDGTYTFGNNDTANDGCEIDIIEANSAANQYSTGQHWDGYGDDHLHSGGNVTAAALHSGYWHTIGLEWTPEFLKFYYDGVLKRTVTTDSQIPHVPEFAILSGGIFEGPWCDGLITEANLPSWGYFDWIRIHKNNQMDWGTKKFVLANKYSGLVTWINNWDGATAKQEVYTDGDDDELWSLNHLGAGKYRITPKHAPNKCLGVASDSTAGKALLKQRPWSDTNARKWTVTFDSHENGRDFYRIKNVNSGKYATLSSASTNENVTIEQQAWWNGDVQKWEIICEDGVDYYVE